MCAGRKSKAFQLTPSRRATSDHCPSSDGVLFQLTPSRRATTTSKSSNSGCPISTHALTEGDLEGFSARCDEYAISTHALTEGDEESFLSWREQRTFQLTPSRRATEQRNRCGEQRYISTHALTEGDFVVRHALNNFIISTHALTEGDRRSNSSCSSFVISTHALTEGDHDAPACSKGRFISTHALTEGDVRSRMGNRLFCHFNSRPHGGRREGGEKM